MIRITNIGTSVEEAGATLFATICCGDPSLDGVKLWFRYPREYGGQLSDSADPWIAALLWPAMRLGQDLVIDAPASSRLVEAVPTLMSIMHCWDARFNPIEIRAPGTLSQRAVGGAVASFFSGGVDSFYTALKNTSSAVPAGESVTHLMSVHGLDVRLQDQTLWGMVRSRLSEAARHLGCTWVESATNVRDVIPEHVTSWQMHHGAVLAGLALGIRGFWRKVLIAADQTYADMSPYGSHPLVNPLWSTESVRIVNDGAEATRIQKILWQVARSDVALRYLRVCWENRDSQYNCGRCEKCIRTMVNLEIAGVLKQCRSFDRSLEYKEVGRIEFDSIVQRNLMMQNYEAAVAAGSDPALIRAIRTCLYPPLHRKLRHSLLRRGRRWWEKWTSRKVNEQ